MNNLSPLQNQLQPHLNDPNGTIRTIKRPSQRRRDGLIQYAYDRTSQSGEDGIIERLFQLLPTTSTTTVTTHSTDDDKRSVRWCVDVGAWDGVHLSNTHSLLVASSSSSTANENDKNENDTTSKGKQHKKKKRQSSNAIPNAAAKSKSGINSGTKIECAFEWRGVLIEADETKFKQLQSLHEPLGNICHNVAVSCQSWSKQSLGHILSSSSSCGDDSDDSADWNGHNKKNNNVELPYNFDFLCIDVDGTDYWLLHNLLLNTKYRPLVICIEFNPTIPHSVLYIPPRDDTIRHGCSISALVELTSSFGYQLVETTCYNAFFVIQPLYDTYIKQEIPFEPTIESLHEITMGTSLYQLYDGTIKLRGCQKLLWHRIPIREDDIQVLKRNERSFPFAPSESNSNAVSATTATTSTNTSNAVGYHDTEQSVDCLDTTEEKLKKIQLEQEEMMFHHLAIDMSPYCISSDGSAKMVSTTSTTATSDKSLQSSSKKIEQRLKCSLEIYQQLKQDGFALIRGSGISSNTCNQALQSSNLFLQKAPENVRRSCMTKDRARRGYSPPNSENFASLIGVNGSNDLVRKFRVGPSLRGESNSIGTSSHVNDERGTTHISASSSLSSSSFALLQPNAWPTTDSWGEDNASHFQSSIQSYYDHICKVAHAIVDAICDGIKHYHTEMKPYMQLSSTTSSTSTSCTRNTSILTLLGYRKGARHQGKHATPLVAAHTDVGVITVLLFDGGTCTSAKLQRCESNDIHYGSTSNIKPTSWVDVKLPSTIPQDPIFVVNIGDCLSDMCNGILPSTLHRVMPCKGGTIPRNCLALFVGLSPDEKIVLPKATVDRSSCNEIIVMNDNDDDDDIDKKDDDQPLCITYGEWRRRRIARAQAELSKNKLITT